MKKHRSYKAFLSEILSYYIEFPKSQFLCHHLEDIKKAGQIKNPRYLERLKKQIKSDCNKYKDSNTLHSFMQIENPEAFKNFIKTGNRHKLIQEYLKMKISEI